MKKGKWINYVFWIALTEAVGLISGLLIREGTETYSEAVKKPPLSPPAILFPIVWSVLYLLMGVAAARISLKEPSASRKKNIYVYLVQLFFNFFWGIIFFDFQAFGIAFIWLVVLWLLIVFMIIRFKNADEASPFLLAPYLLWVSFAGYLNLAVWALNK